MNYQFYTGNERGNNTAQSIARLKLCLFDEQTVADICDLVQRRGKEGVLNDVFYASTDADPPHILGVLSPNFIKYQDQPGVILGLATVIQSSIRKPKMGEDEYAEILTTAFGLPEFYARKLVSQIESYDEIVADANRDGDTTLGERLNQYLSVVEEGARRVVNGLSSALGTQTLLNWDQTQQYDVDFLYELDVLGRIVSDLARRARLVTGQALIAQTFNLFQTGDIEEGDSDEKLVGDILSAVGTRNLPDKVSGNFRDLMLKSRMSSMKTGAQLFSQAGVTIDPVTKTVKMGKPKTKKASKVQSLLKSILGGSPAVGLLKGIAGLSSKTKSKATSAGDPQNALAGDIANLYGDITDEYGEPLAQAWLSGDIESVLAHALEADDAGDPMSDNLNYAVGDADPSGSEVGGLFKRKKRKLSPAAAMRKRIARDAKEARQAYELQQKIARANADAAARASAAGTSAYDYLGKIDPSQGLAPVYASETNLDFTTMPATGSLPPNVVAAADLAGIPDLDPGDLYDRLSQGVSIP